MKMLAFGTALATMALMATASTAVAQWTPIECELSTGHYLVNSARLYLRSAGRTKFPSQRERDLRDAHRVLTQAIEEGRDNDPAVWYLLGRWYAIQRDLAGADSAFDKAVGGAPQCRDDILTHRRRLWVPVLNRGVDALRADELDAAKTEFRIANEIFDAEPMSYYYLAQAHQNSQQSDSAIANYRLAIEIANREENRDNEQFADIPERASFNVALLYNNERQYDSAVVWFQRYRNIKPDDYEAMTAQATALSLTGRTDDALVLYDSVLLRADEMPALQLFETGAALFRAARYELATQAFRAGLERNPYFRDALYNLVNTYFRMSELDSGLTDEEADARKTELGEKMQPIAERLIAVDPASTTAMRLLAASYLLRRVDDSTVATLERIEQMTFDVTISVFRSASDGGYELRGLITNQSEGEAAVPTLTFEFLDEAGEVIESTEIPAQILEEGGGAPIGIRASSDAIAAWRYSLGA